MDVSKQMAGKWGARRWQRWGLAAAGACLALSGLAAWSADRWNPGSAGTLPAPDYTQPDAWAARPGLDSHANDTPAGVPRAEDPAVDVFFIHPTTYLKPVIGNAPYDAGGFTRSQLDAAVLKFQASVFNGCCHIYAPRYRQSSLRAITSDDAQSHAADEIAYSDVARAFEQFLHDIHGRPFIIASHSQGSIHALRLLQDKVMGTPLQQRLVVAYLPGVALPLDIEARGLPVCRSATATRCVVSWNSVRRGHDDIRRRESAEIWWDGRYQTIAGRPMVCVNPLDWRLGGDAPAQDNLGAVYSAGREQPIPAPEPAVTAARCNHGLLEVDPRPEDRRHFSDILTLGGVYHDFDYALYYMNIRDNVAQRIAAFEGHGTSTGSE